MLKGNGWIRFLRVLIYALAIPGTTIGASLIKTGSLSSAYADGTYAAKIQNGEIIFYTSLIILSLNIIWGVLRWSVRGYNENWRIGRIIGKLIGGGIWRTLVIFPLFLISALIIAPRVSALITDNVADKETALVSLSQDYDELKYIDESFESLDLQTIEEKLGPLMFNTIDFDTDASTNVSHHKASIFVNDASAYSSTVTILNKAVLSDAGHFVVFYTDTGDDRISDDRASGLAAMLEEIIAGYKNNLGFDYKYEKLPNNNSKLRKMQEVLKKSNISENILDSAMPVYIVDPYKKGSPTLATYAGRRFKDLGANILVKIGSVFGEETARLYNSTPSYPFINIRPQNAESESLAIVTAHELGHHYVGTYNYETYGGTGSDDDFIDETAPNWMAINALPPYQPSSNLINRNHYNYVYLGAEEGNKVKIDEAVSGFLGYPLVAFLENYYRIVPNAKTIILDAAYLGNALAYLYEKAGYDNYQEVMVSLAEKNLTGDYDGKLINTVRPSGEILACTDFCDQTYQIKPSSTRYLYFATSEYLDTYISFSSSNNYVRGSVLGLNLNGEYEVIDSNKGQLRYAITDETLQRYEVIAFAIASSSISLDGTYKIEIVDKELDDLIEAIGEYDFGDWYTALGAGCYEVDTDALFDNLTGLIDLGSDTLSVLSRINSDDLSNLQTEYDNIGTEAKDHINQAKNELSPYRITVCANYIKPGETFENIKKRLTSAIGTNLTIHEELNGSDKMSIFFGFDLLERRGKIYVLGQHENDMGLITISVTEK